MIKIMIKNEKFYHSDVLKTVLLWYGYVYKLVVIPQRCRVIKMTVGVLTTCHTQYT